MDWCVADDFKKANHNPGQDWLLILDDADRKFPLSGATD